MGYSAPNPSFIGRAGVPPFTPAVAFRSPFPTFIGGLGTVGIAPPVVPPAAPTEKPAGRRTRRRIVLRINGEICEADDLPQVLEVLKQVKRDIRDTAKEAAQNIVRTGKRIGEAKREQAHAIEVVDAPYSVRDMIQTRLDELQKVFWKRVEVWLRRIREEDDTMMLL